MLQSIEPAFNNSLSNNSPAEVVPPGGLLLDGELFLNPFPLSTDALGQSYPGYPLSLLLTDSIL